MATTPFQSAQGNNQSAMTARCPRCPFNSGLLNNNARRHTTLTECYERLQLGTDYAALDDLWPLIMLTRDGLERDEQAKYDSMSAVLLGDDGVPPDGDIAREMVKLLQDGQVKYGDGKSFRFTKEMAEDALRVKVVTNAARAAARDCVQAEGSRGKGVQED